MSHPCFSTVTLLLKELKLIRLRGAEGALLGQEATWRLPSLQDVYTTLVSDVPRDKMKKCIFFFFDTLSSLESR